MHVASVWLVRTVHVLPTHPRMAGFLQRGVQIFFFNLDHFDIFKSAGMDQKRKVQLLLSFLVIVCLLVLNCKIPGNLLTGYSAVAPLLVFLSL